MEEHGLYKGWELRRGPADLTPAQRGELLIQLEGWAGRLLRIHAEIDLVADTGVDFWGPFDLVGAYHGRERIERLLVDCEVSFAVDAIDRLLLSFSEEIGVAWLASLGLEDERGDGWWWGFVPVRGPLRWELDDRLRSSGDGSEAR